MKALDHEDLLLLKEEPVQELPHTIRMRLDETFLMLDDIQPIKAEERRRKRWVRRSLLITLGAAAAGILLIGSGFVSPVMAQALKQIPFIESVFKQAGDRGLQKASEEGFTTNANQNITHNGVTISLSEVMYDGSRLNLVLNRDKLPAKKTPGAGTDWFRSSTLGLNNIEFYVNGSWVNTGMSLASGGGKAPNSIIVTALNSPNLHIPDEFELKMLVKLDDVPEPYEFELPVKKVKVKKVVITPEEMKIFDHIHMKVAKLEITPVTTRLDMEITGEKGQSLRDIANAIPEKYKVTDFIQIDYDLTDDQGVLQKSIGANGTGEEDHYSYSTSYEPFTAIPKFVTVKPYVYVTKTRQKNYIPELEFTVQVK
ncbi:DUF4179 domain-containing protein [Paenibacillus dokdonensis]|uniref:DUF4179 domain-containing protein n=1 Tax=Paenibacillus dokdonensis TaxID=2567944 RepID=A0ABU6GRM8_9BACL|nr:DUF4179 domain-containing protein [Paenibacillus dokdonensis]MEC0242415.1 DUF4179 domain-containing protein [Paenibacillus dokdonensis]